MRRTLGALAVCGMFSSHPFISLSQTLRSDVNLVNILATVRDGNGRIVSGLAKDDFVLAEDGRPQALHDFAAQSNLPLALGLLVDTSGSMRFALEEERMASHQFLKSALRPEGDRALIMRFDSAVVTLSHLEASPKRLKKALEDIAPSPLDRTKYRGRSTALFDAIVEAAEHLKAVPGHKAIIVLTDGLDAGSFSSEDDAVQAALRSDLSVYTVLVSVRQFVFRDRTITLPDTTGYQRALARGRKTLKTLSEQTGGISFEANDKNQFNRVYQQITEELRNQYRIGLQCDEAGSSPGYHALSLATRRGDLVVRSRKGFYIGDGPAKLSTDSEPTPSARFAGTSFLSQARDLVIQQRSRALKFIAQEHVQCAGIGEKHDESCNISAEIEVDQSARVVRRLLRKDAADQLQMVGGTSISEFGVELPNIFRSLRLEEFHEVQDGTALQRFDFVVGIDITTWRIWQGENWLPVSYAGSIWIDPQSRQVVRLERIAKDLPIDARADLVQSVIDFAPADLGGDTPAMLPSHVEERICERISEVCQQISSSIQFRRPL